VSDNVTRAEAAERSQLISVDAYDVDLDLTTAAIPTRITPRITSSGYVRPHPQRLTGPLIHRPVRMPIGMRAAGAR
jgi:hypothetical protein